MAGGCLLKNVFKFQFSGQCPLTMRDFRPASIVTPLGSPDSLLRFKFQFIAPSSLPSKGSLVRSIPIWSLPIPVVASGDAGAGEAGFNVIALGNMVIQRRVGVQTGEALFP